MGARALGGTEAPRSQRQQEEPSLRNPQGAEERERRGGAWQRGHRGQGGGGTQQGRVLRAPGVGVRGGGRAGPLTRGPDKGLPQAQDGWDWGGQALCGGG